MGKRTVPIVAARLKSDRAVALARSLRKRMTAAEKLLWRELRRFPVGGSHWRKQTPIGPFVVDFACHSAGVVVELDGGVHRIPDVVRRDAEREAFFVARGYRVLRFANAEVATDVGKVVRTILAASLPPCGGGQGGG